VAYQSFYAYKKCIREDKGLKESPSINGSLLKGILYLKMLLSGKNEKT